MGVNNALCNYKLGEKVANLMLDKTLVHMTSKGQGLSDRLWVVLILILLLSFPVIDAAEETPGTPDDILSELTERPSVPAIDAYLSSLSTPGNNMLDAEHRSRLLECLRNLEVKIREIMQGNQAALDELLAAQADIALLRVTRVYLATQTLNRRYGTSDVLDTRRRQVESHIKAFTTGSTAERDAKASTLYDFFSMIQYRNDDVSFESTTEQNQLLTSLKNFSDRYYRTSSSTEKARYSLTDNDLIVIRNLYSHYRPDNRPDNSFMQTIFSQLGRNFARRDVNDSDRVANGEQMRRASSRYSTAKSAFVTTIKNQMKQYLAGTGTYAGRPDHKCSDFIDTNTGKFKRPNAASTFCSAGIFLDSIMSSRPLNDISALLNVLNPNKYNLGAINPHIHARRLFHNLMGCQISKNANGDWEVNLELYLEHLHGNSESAAVWFINTGKDFEATTRESGNDYYSCNRGGVAYRNTDFVRGPACIDRPIVHRGSDKHEHVFGRSRSDRLVVNLGDTRQDHVTLLGTTEPIDAQGVTVRPANPNGTISSSVSQRGQPESNLVMRRELPIGPNCRGFDAYSADTNGSTTITAIAVVPTPDGTVTNVGIRETHYDLHAKTTPLLTRGTYHWSCKTPTEIVDPAQRESACNKVTQYGAGKEAGVFPRLAQDYTVKVQYFSSVQRREAPLAEFLIPKLKPIHLRFEKVPAQNTPTTIAVKLIFETQEDPDAIRGGALRWKTCPATATPCATAPAADGIYQFPIQSEAYEIEAEWFFAPNWSPTSARTNIDRDDYQLSLEQISENNTDNTVLLKPSLTAPSNIQDELTRNLKWTCVSTLAANLLPAQCNNTSASLSSNTSFPKLPQGDYSVQVWVEHNSHRRFSNSISVRAIPTLPPTHVRLAWEEDTQARTLTQVKIRPKMVLTPENSSIRVLSFSITCQKIVATHEIEIPSDCAGQVEGDPKAPNYKTYTRLAHSYNLVATLTVEGQPPIISTRAIPETDPPVQITLGVVWESDAAASTATTVSKRPKMTVTPADANVVVTSFAITCAKKNASDTITIPANCAGAVEGDPKAPSYRSYSKLSAEYNLIATLTVAGRPDPIVVPTDVPALDPPPTIDIQVVWDENSSATTPTSVSKRPKMVLTPANATVVVTGFEITCAKKNASDTITIPANCPGPVVGDPKGPDYRSFSKLAAEYTLTATLTVAGRPDPIIVPTDVPALDPPPTIDIQVVWDENTSAATSTSVSKRPKMVLTPANATVVVTGFQITCAKKNAADSITIPTDCASAVAEPYTAPAYKNYTKLAKAYDLTATLTIAGRAAPIVTQTSVSELANTNDSYTVDANEDSASRDKTYAKFTAFVSKNRGTTDASDEGTLKWEWTYKGTKKEVSTKSIQADRDSVDITGKLTFTPSNGSPAVDTEFLIKKLPASATANGEPVEPPLPPIPPSPPPQRFVPTMLPPPPGGMIIPGFD